MKSLAILLCSAASLFAHEGHHHTATAEMTNAASTFLKSLDDSQSKAAKFEFKNEERENWHFVPMKREGIRFSTLKPHQQHLAFGLLGTGLSQKGLLTATQIMTLEQVLADRGGDPEIRDTEKYYLAVFGTPSNDKPWGWRFEGHHLSLNFTVIGNRVVGVPAFFGTNPAELKKGPLKGTRPLGEVEDAGRALAVKLKASGKSPVFSEKAPKEIFTGQDRIAKAQEALGVASNKLEADEITDLLKIVDLVASLQRHDVSADALKKILTAQSKKLTFAWAGSLERNGAHYFRIQGPDFIIEYANTQNDANHAHLVWRDLKNDFARDVLKTHYTKDH
ncbi:DUF3500 domain-containing protein [Akkermansiaceae bacterium]|nr:DUF3500 domain-containing protein [Akkermansiaceae bacterium]